MEFEIKPKNKLSLGLKELWDYRELFYFFTWRDVKVKYKQAALGIMWAVLQPLVMMIQNSTASAANAATMPETREAFQPPLVLART